MIPAFRHHLKKSTVIIIVIMTVMGCRFYFKTTSDNFSSHSTTISLENGKNLTYNVCGSCHFDARVNKFIGKPLHDLPAIGGRLYTANLTQSATNGIPPKYSDAELFYLLKTGIAKNGKFMPYMMRPMMADEDINDIIIYLRSGDLAVSAADTTVGLTHINFIGKTGIRLTTKPEPYNKGIARPDENDGINYGRYLIAVTGCYHCHSKNTVGVDYGNPEQSKGYMQGGRKMKDPKGKKIYGPNLTPDKETGIGNINLADFTSIVRNGITNGGRHISPPMPTFSHLTDKQVNAIYSYLNSLGPVNHNVKRT